jgi:DNA-binding winged helix-turn-helix (wHTH) protein
MELEHFESLYPEDTRFKEIEKILTLIKEGNSCQVVSAAGVGRSNLLGLFSYNKNIRTKHLGLDQKNYHFVLLNFSEIRKRPLSDATKFIFLGILDSLRERGMENDYAEINKIFKESSEFNDELVLFQGLKKTVDYFAIQNKLTLVLLFDRFEEYVPSLTPEFFANLRVLRNRAKYHFSVVFSLNRPLEDLIEPMLFADYFEFAAGRIIYLPIEDKAGLMFRISHLEKVSGKKIDKLLVDKTLDLTSGHGKLTILCLETLLSLEGKIPTIKEQLIEHLLSQRPIRSSLFAIWNSLNPSEQQYFIDKNQEPIFLEQIGLCYNGKITIPLFEHFIKQNILTNQQKYTNNNIEVDEKTSEIRLGEAIISDQLTSSEFKLLSFLISNKDKIVQKEDIINAVWGEKTTTLGVSDQALDQLIFRLRKKIENNPNKPEHIITVKGRGFKFVS